MSEKRGRRGGREGRPVAEERGTWWSSREAEMDGGDGDKTVAGEAEGKMTQNGNMILV